VRGVKRQFPVGVANPVQKLIQVADFEHLFAQLFKLCRIESLKLYRCGRLGSDQAMCLEY
jgi:hypothetical protein